MTWHNGNIDPAPPNDALTASEYEPRIGELVPREGIVRAFPAVGPRPSSANTLVRYCNFEGCKTQLSKYNFQQVCALHAQTSGGFRTRGRPTK